MYGWFMGLPKARKKLIREYLTDDYTPDEQMYRKLVSLAMMSAAKTCIIPLQDWAGLDNDARMNCPGTVEINWSWRMTAGMLTKELAREILTVTKRFGRANWDALNALEAKKKHKKMAKNPKDEVNIDEIV
jgi:4-alpha-glucanotransferase